MKILLCTLVQEKTWKTYKCYKKTCNKSWRPTLDLGFWPKINSNEN